MDNRYDDMTCEQLAALAQQGDDGATETLIHRFRVEIRGRARRYFIVGADSDDVIQEAMIGLFKAIRTYDAARGAGFATFAGLCMDSQILTAIKSATRKKNAPLNSSVSLSSPSDDDPDLELADMIAASAGNDPEMILIAKEIEQYISDNIGSILSDLELAALTSYMNGDTCGEIAEKLGKDPKTVYNAVSRAKKKLAERLDRR